MPLELKIRMATMDDAELLFRWANDPETRKNSFNSNIIRWEDHIKWLNSKIYDPKSNIYILTLDNSPIGTTKTEQTSDTIIGITVAPEYRGKGLGSAMIKKTCEKYWESNDNDIFAYIKSMNVKSKNVFEKAGFIFFETKKKDNINCEVFKTVKK